MASPNPRFWCNGSLRIMDAGILHPEIIEILGPGSECHRKGDNDPDRDSRPWKNDIWMIDTDVPEQNEIVDHLRWLCDFIAPHEGNIRDWISRGARIDFYFSYACDHNHCGFGLPPELLAIFPRLGIRLEISIMN